MLPKILWASDTPSLPTGYAQVSRNILLRMKLAGFNVEYFGFQQVMTNHVPSLIPINYPVHMPLYPTGPCHGQEFYGNKGSLEEIIKRTNPDIVAFLCDSFMLKWMTEKRIYEKDGNQRIMTAFDNLKERKKKTLFYFPFDSDEVYEGAESVQKEIDIRVAMSRFSQKVLKRDTGLDSFYIPHGVDTNVYRRLPKDILESAKKENKIDNKFIVGCVARNQTRKMLTRLFDAFKEFSKDKDDVVLFMHCDPKDPQGHNLSNYANKLGLKNVIFGMKNLNMAPNENFVNLIYNLFDIHVLPTSGEGFGLSIIESMAVGIPNICTNYTTAKELLGNGRGMLARWDDYVIGQLNTKRVLINTKDLLKKMNKLYDNPELRRKISERARKHVLEHYSWEKVVRMWTELFQFGEIYEKP